MRISDENLRGRTVIAADGTLLGDVSDLFLDSESWHVDTLQVKLRKEAAERLGAEHRLFRAGHVEVNSNMVQSVGDTVVLSVTIDALRPMQPASEPEEESAPS